MAATAAAETTPTAPVPDKAPKGKAEQKPADTKVEKTEVETDQQRSSDVAGEPTENPAPDDDKAAKGNEPLARTHRPEGLGEENLGQNPVDKKCCTC